MSSNEDLIKENYKFCEEDNRATQSRYMGLEFSYTKKIIDEYINQNKTVIELGCATGYYAMHYASKCKEYVGIDISPENISVFNEKIKANKLVNVVAKIGDATNLCETESNSFDVVLCFGPMYHLLPEERELVFAECRRICKDGGIVAFAYINKLGSYVGACVDENLREYYPSERANKFILETNEYDRLRDLFFYTMAEEIESDALRFGLQKVKNLGVDFYITLSIIDAMSDERFELMKPLLDQMSSYESCTGLSNHAVLICRKEEI